MPWDVKKWEMFKNNSHGYIRLLSLIMQLNHHVICQMYYTGAVESGLINPKSTKI